MSSPTRLKSEGKYRESKLETNNQNSKMKDRES